MDNISSQRNKEKFSHEGFIYIFDKKSADGNRKMWRCERKDYSRRARTHTDSVTGEVLKNLGDHTITTVMPQRLKWWEWSVVTALKRRAIDTNEGTAQVINHTVQNLSQAVQGQPSIRICTEKDNSMTACEGTSTATYARKTPGSNNISRFGLTPIRIPTGAVRSNFEPFLLAKHPGPDNVILFGRNRNLDLLERVKRWYISMRHSVLPRDCSIRY